MMQSGAEQQQTGMTPREVERHQNVSSSSPAGYRPEQDAPLLHPYNYRDFSRIPPPPGESPYPESINDMTFAQKVHHMLFHTTEFTWQAIRWCRHGRAFRVVDPLLLEATMELLPKHFGHDEYSKFFSDLSRAGFHQISRGPDAGCFWNEFFLQGLPHLCKYIPDEAPQESRPRSDPDFQDIADKYPLPGFDKMDDETKTASSENSTDDCQNTSIEDALLLLSHPSLRQLLSPESRDALTRSFNQDPKLPVHPSLGNMSREEISQLFAPQLAISPSLRRALGFASDENETTDEKIDSGVNTQPAPLNFYPGFQSWFGETQGERLQLEQGLDALRSIANAQQQQQRVVHNVEAPALLQNLQQQQQSLLNPRISHNPRPTRMPPGHGQPQQHPMRSIEAQLREIQLAIAMSQNQQQLQQQVMPDNYLLSLLDRQSTRVVAAQQQLNAQHPRQITEGDQILALQILLQLHQGTASPPNNPGNQHR